MGYSSLTIGIIVLCIVSGLAVTALSVFLLVKRRWTSNALVKIERQQDETPEWWPWSLSSPPPPLVVPATNSINHPGNATHKSKYASFLPSIKKKKVSTTTPARTMLDDIPLPPSLTTPTSTPLYPPAPVATTYLAKWKQKQEVEKRSPIVVFEEGYDPNALLRSPYYHPNQQHRTHQQRAHHLLPCTTTANAPLPSPPPANDDSFFSVDDPCLLESLERQKHINDMYYRTTPAAAKSASTSTTTVHCHHRSSPSWGSATIIQSPCIYAKCTNNNSSLLSLSVAEKLEQDAELQRLSISSYHVW